MTNNAEKQLTALLQTRVRPEEKAQFLSQARRRGLTQSELLRLAITPFLEGVEGYPPAKESHERVLAR